MDSAINKDGNYFPQLFLKELIHWKKVIRHIIHDLKSSSDDSEDSDEE